MGATKKIVRNMDTTESRAFWESAVKIAKQVDDWPAWKKGWVMAASIGQDGAGQCKTTCEHGSRCTLAAGHDTTRGHETGHGCICYDDIPSRR